LFIDFLSGSDSQGTLWVAPECVNQPLQSLWVQLIIVVQGLYEIPVSKMNSLCKIVCFPKGNIVAVVYNLG